MIASTLFDVIFPYFSEKGLDWFLQICGAKENIQKFQKELKALDEDYRVNHEDIYDVVGGIISDTTIINEIILFCTTCDKHTETLNQKITGIIDGSDTICSINVKYSIAERSEIKDFFIKLCNLICNIFILPKNKELKQLVNIFYSIRNDIINNMETSNNKSFWKMKEVIKNVIEESFKDKIIDDPFIRNKIYCYSKNINKYPEFNVTFSRWLRRNSDICDIMFERSLEGHLGIVPPLLLKAWNDFIMSDQWHEKTKNSIINIADSLRFYLNDDNKILKQIYDYDFNENYVRLEKDLLNLLEELIEELDKNIENEKVESIKHKTYKALKNKIFELKKTIINSNYNRCFFITGKIGSGKSHFIYQLLSSFAKQETKEGKIQYMYLFLKSDEWINDNMENVILAAVEKMTDVTFADLDKLNNALINKGIKLIIIIDNLQDIINNHCKNNILDNFKDTITSSTRLHSFYWLISVRESCLGMIKLDDIFWRKYGTIPENYNELGSKFDKPYIGSWLSIDMCNEASDIPIHILVSVMNLKDKKMSYEELKAHFDKNQFPYNTLNPLTAWIFSEFVDIKDIREAKDLVYIDFINAFWEKRNSELNKIMESAFIKGFHDFNDIIKDIIIISADFFLTNSDIVFKKNDLVKEIASNISEVADIGNIAIETLEKGNLLEKVKKINKALFLQQTEEKFQMNFEVCWAYCMAMRLVDKNIDLEEFFLKLDKFVEDRIENTCLKQLDDEVLEFTILIIDKNIDKIQRSNDFMSKFFLKEYMLVSPIWFAGFKASINTKKRISQILLEQKVLVNNKNIYAVLFFIKQLDDEVMLPDLKIKALQPFYKIIFENNIVSYYVYICECILRSIENTEKLLDCIKYFAFCEPMNITDILVNMVIKNLFRLENNDVEKITMKIVTFSKKNEEIIKKSVTEKKQFQYYFFQDFYCGFCCAAFGMMEIDSYKILKKNRWYNWELINEKRSSSAFWMLQAANLEFGRWYQKASYNNKVDYINLVEKLSKSKEAIDLQCAFYMIKHSVPQRKDKLFKIHEEFIPILKRLTKSTNKYLISEINKLDNRKFIDFNLKKSANK